MQYARHAKPEGFDDRLELRAILGHHLVAALHRAFRRFEHGTAGVAIMIARLDQGLCANDAEAAHLLNLLPGIGDGPVAADELSCDAADVGDSNRLGEHVAILIDVGLLRHELRFHADCYFITFGGGHAQEIKPVVGELGVAE